MQQVRIKDIGEHQFEITQLPTGKARRLLVRLFKVAGPTMATFVDLAMGTKSIGDIGTEQLVGGIEMLAAQITEQDLDHLVAELLTRGSGKIKIGADFLTMDEKILDENVTLGDQFKLIAFALQVNYADFLGDWVKRGKPAMTPEAAQASS